MKKKEKQSIVSMKVTELDTLMKDTMKALADWRINRYSKQSKNVREGRALRRKLAVVSSVRRAKELSHE